MSNTSFRSFMRRSLSSLSNNNFNAYMIQLNSNSSPQLRARRQLYNNVAKYLAIAQRHRAAVTIQKHVRGTAVRKPKIVLVQNPNNGNIMLATSVRAPILKKLHTAKVRTNTRARLYGN